MTSSTNTTISTSTSPTATVDDLSALKNRVLAATFGATTTSLIVTPLEVVKVRMQADPLAMAASRNHHTMTRIVKNISQREGILSLWSGLTPTLAMALPATVCYYVGYDYITGVFNKKTNTKYMVPMLAGASARFLSVCLISPLELFKTRLQENRSIPKKGASEVLRQMMLDIPRRGISSTLYRGLSPTLWRDVPFSAMYWSLYELLREEYFPRPTGTSSLSTDPLTNLRGSFFSGVIAGTVSSALTTPFDVVKTRQQILRNSQNNNRCGVVRHLIEIAKAEGIPGLFSGMIPRLLKISPACAVMIGSYEFLKDISNVK